MKVTAKLFATLRDHAPLGSSGRAFEVEAAAGATVQELLDAWEIPGDMPLLILVNSVHATRDHVLRDGDVLAVFPPIAGG